VKQIEQRAYARTIICWRSCKRATFESVRLLDFLNM